MGMLSVFILHSPVSVTALCQLPQARAEVKEKGPGWAPAWDQPHVG